MFLFFYVHGTVHLRYTDRINTNEMQRASETCRVLTPNKEQKKLHFVGIYMISMIMYVCVYVCMYVCVCVCKYSRTPLVQKLVILNANFPDQLGPSVKHFRTVIVHLFIT